MAIITKPSTINKGSPSQITLSKSELKVHSAITDAYFQDDENWKTVSIEYKNAEGQKKQLVFDASQASPTDEFLASLKARSDFEVQSITIFDKDGGTFKIPKTALTASEFKLGFTPEALFTRDFSQASAQDVFEAGASKGSNYLSIVPDDGETTFSHPVSGLIQSTTYQVKVHILENTLAAPFGDAGNSVSLVGSSNVGLGDIRAAAWPTGQVKTFNVNYTLSESNGTIKFTFYPLVSGGWNYTGELKISKIEILPL